MLEAGTSRTQCYTEKPQRWLIFRVSLLGTQSFVEEGAGELGLRADGLHFFFTKLIGKGVVVGRTTSSDWQSRFLFLDGTRAMNQPPPKISNCL